MDGDSAPSDSSNIHLETTAVSNIQTEVSDTTNIPIDQANGEDMDSWVKSVSDNLLTTCLSDTTFTQDPWTTMRSILRTFEEANTLDTSTSSDVSIIPFKPSTMSNIQMVVSGASNIPFCQVSNEDISSSAKSVCDNLVCDPYPSSVFYYWF